MEREKILNKVCLKCADFVRQLSVHRAIHNIPNKLRQNFWIYIYNNSIDMAVLDWCHLFGSHTDELHWKNVVDNIDNFRDNMFARLRITQLQWYKYWKSIKDYRDKDVAHIEIRPIYNIPNIELGLNSVCYYYEYIIIELKNIPSFSNYPDDLSEYYNACLNQAQNYIKIAYDATSLLNEEVF